jgi:vacuolar-type H+-ATPase subunit C/Vma6
MKDLLLNPENRGYPTDYLLARIAGKRAHLITEWKPLVLGTLPEGHLSPHFYAGLSPEDAPDAAWRWLEREYRWVYFQMNETLREIFRPFFMYSDLRILFSCLRHIQNSRRTGMIENILALSLLSEKVRALLKTAGDISSAARGLENLFSSFSVEFGGFAKIADAEGSRGLESALAKRYLAYTVRGKLHPLMKSFFVRIIDARNVMSAYKYLRLDEKTVPSFIAGGSIIRTRYSNIADRKDIFGLISVIKKLTGIRIEKPDAANVENSLYRMITKFLKKQGRQPLGVGLILDYLWRCSLEAMNLSILFHGKDLDRETIMAELVR